MVFFIFIAIIAIVMLTVVTQATYYAFVKEKDERSKMIVTRSAAQAFVILFVVNLIFMFFRLVNYEFWSEWWSNFKESIYVEPAILMILLFGIILLINRKKYGE